MKSVSVCLTFITKRYVTCDGISFFVSSLCLLHNPLFWTDSAKDFWDLMDSIFLLV